MVRTFLVARLDLRDHRDQEGGPGAACLNDARPERMRDEQIAVTVDVGGDIRASVSITNTGDRPGT
jgi:hypothetical protein